MGLIFKYEGEDGLLGLAFNFVKMAEIVTLFSSAY